MRWQHSGFPATVKNEVVEIEHHLHSYESWFGAAVVPNGEIHVADRIGDTPNAFVVDAGNDTWGDWLQVLGSSDTPARANKTHYDLHRLGFVNSERTGIHFIQFAYGTSGDVALAAGNVTEFEFTEPVGTAIPEPIVMQGERQLAGTKVWARLYVPSQNTGTLNFFIGLHEYPQ